MILYISYVIPLGTIYMINALKANRAAKFIRKLHAFCFDKTIYNEYVKINRLKRARVCFVLNTFFQMILYLVIVVRYYSIFDWSKECKSLFSSLCGSPWLLKAVCAIFVIMGICSTISVSLTTCFFACVTTNLADEFDKLLQIMWKFASSTRSVGMEVWEQVRFRHEALVSLMCLHDELFTMLLGPILVGYIGYLGFNLYQVLVVEADLICVISVINSISVVGAIITTSNILENKVRELCSPFFSEKHVKNNPAICRTVGHHLTINIFSFYSFIRCA